MNKLMPDSHTFRFLTAVTLSMLLHSAVITQFSTPQSFISKHHSPSPIDKKLVLEFIPVSQDISEKQPLVPTPIISEKSTVAQNLISKPELPKGIPYQQGSVEHQAIAHQMAKPSSPISLSQKHNPLNKKARPTKPEKKELGGKKAVDQLSSDSKNKEPWPTEDRQDTRASDSKILPPQTQGKDDFVSPAQKNISSTADILEEWSYNSQSHTIARYFSKELKKIANIWNLELISALESSTTPRLPVKKTVVVFKIMPDGTIRNLQIIEHDGSILSQRYPIMAIEKAAPLRPLPKSVLSYIRADGLWIKIDFNYSTPRRK